jgi:hypothetical protein
MTVGGRLDELHGNPHPAARAQHRPFDGGVHAQFGRDRGQRLRRRAVAHRRGTGDDAQRGDPAEVRGQQIREPVGEVLLSRRLAQVDEGQDHERALRAAPGGADRRAMKGGFDRLHAADEPIADARHRFEVSRRLGRVAQRLAQLRDAPDEGAVAHGHIAPHEIVQVALADQTSLPLDEAAQRLEDLRLERNVPAAAIEAMRLEVERELPEPIGARA